MQTDSHADNKDLAESSSNSAQTSGPFRWLIENEPRRLLLPLTGLWVLGLDWLLFSANSFSLGLGTPLSVVLGFLLGGVGAFFFQKRFAKDPVWKALLKALVIGIVVGAPWPVGGTLIGGWVLLAAGLGKSIKDVLRK